MEAAGLGVGVVGLVGLFSTCLDMVERWDSYNDFSFESGAIKARFFADRVRFRQWGRSVGISEGKLNHVHHSALDDSSIRLAIDLVLRSVENLNETAKSKAPNLAHFPGPADLQLESNYDIPNGQMHFAKLQIAPSRRNRLGWALKGRARALTIVASFEALVQKLYDLVPAGPVTAENQETAREGRGELAASSFDDSSLWHEDAQRILVDLEKLIHYDTRKELRDWLDAPDTKRNYDDFVLKRLYGTCDWIFHRLQFQQWKSFAPETPRILWINGPPGYGKTILCARIIEYMSTTQTNLAYFFFSSEMESRADPFVIITSWIAQLLTQGQAFDLARERWEAVDGRAISKIDIKELFSTLVHDLPPCTFVVDGLDECAVAEGIINQDHHSSLFDFLRFLTHVIVDSESQVLIVSRNDLRVRQGLNANGNGMTGQFVEIQISPKDVEADASTFSRSIVSRKLSNKSEAQRKVLADRLADRCESMFLAIKLLEDDLRGGLNMKQLQRAIDQAPNKLDHIYDRDWERIQSLDSSRKHRAFSILRWVTFAARPLTVLEITECLLLPNGEDGDIDYEELPDFIDQVYVRTEILELCGSLIEIRAKPKSDLGDSTIHLTHFSVKQYVLCHMHAYTADPIANEQLVSSNESVQNNLIAKACLHYLNSDQTWNEALLERHNSAVLTRPFREYAAHSWPIHVSRGVVNSREIFQLVNAFFRPSNPKWGLWRKCYDNGFPVNSILGEGKQEVGNPLYYASLLGLMETVDYLIDEIGLEVDHVDSSSRTALLAACSIGHVSSAARLLARGANANLKTHDGATPLHVAAYCGHVDIVRLLLENGSDLEIRDRDRWTPLVAASHGGHVEAVRLLLDRGAEREVQTEFDPLIIAIYRGYTQLVKLLIEKGASLCVKSPNGLSPLVIASDLGHAEIVRLLIANGANPGASSRIGLTTSLLAASSQGHVEVVEILLDSRADCGTPTKSEQKALRTSVQSDFADIVGEFLEGFSVETVEPTSGRSLLSYATEYQNADVVEYLLERGADPSLRDKLGRTPLFFAAYFGNVALFSSFLSKGVTSIDDRDVYGSTPFSIAVRHGHVHLVKYLLARGGVDLASKDEFGRTVSSWAKSPEIRRAIAKATNQHDATIATFDTRLPTTSLATRVGTRECDGGGSGRRVDAYSVGCLARE
ncbi:ankyrin repeat-containing domain protein [Nemania abortiva]|nr:ankyrin repeat-containing domain protein [Nemania abortiva]